TSLICNKSYATPSTHTLLRPSYTLHFYVYCALPYLHSFPTRRSSDLSAFRFGLAREFFQGFANQARCNLHLELLYGDEPHHIVEDRKSTRLNSSHQIISYAVFCLKKKKKTPPALSVCRYIYAHTFSML